MSAVQERIEEVLRRIGEMDGAIAREGKAVPAVLGQVAASLAAMRNGHTEPASRHIDVVEPTPPPSTLPPELQDRWDDFAEFLTAINQHFGRPNQDQYIYLAEIAATLAITGAEGGGTGDGIGEAPPTGLVYGRDGLVEDWVLIPGVTEIDGGQY